MGFATGTRIAMISEIVLFSLPEGLSREEAIAKYRARIPMWQGNPELIHKAFLYDEGSRQGGGVYLWKNIEAAKKAHGHKISCAESPGSSSSPSTRPAADVARADALRDDALKAHLAGVPEDRRHGRNHSTCTPLGRKTRQGSQLYAHPSVWHCGCGGPIRLTSKCSGH
jgi:hypothetical protein